MYHYSGVVCQLVCVDVCRFGGCGWWGGGGLFCQAEDGIRDLVRSRGLGDVYKRQSKCSDVRAFSPICIGTGTPVSNGGIFSPSGHS